MTENTDNSKNVIDRVKYTGFGDLFAVEILDNIRKPEKSFTISGSHSYGEDKEDKVDSKLYFNKSDKNNTFFNKYDLTVTLPGKDPISNTFYVSKDVKSNITLKEAYNLLSGRSVNKTFTKKNGEEYTAWARLDLSKKDKYENYEMIKYGKDWDYNLKDQVDKLPLVFENGEDKQKVIDSLEKGNKTKVKFLVGGNEYTRFIEANPQHKTINIHGSLDNVSKEEKRKIDDTNKAQGEGKEQGNALPADEGNSQNASKSASQKKTAEKPENSEPPRRKRGVRR